MTKRQEIWLMINPSLQGPCQALETTAQRGRDKLGGVEAEALGPLAGPSVKRQMICMLFPPRKPSCQERKEA